MIQTKYIPINTSNSQSKLKTTFSKVTNQPFSTPTNTQNYFYQECDDFLQEMCIFCQKIQLKAYQNIKESSQLMEKYKIITEIKFNIDQLWQKTKSNMKKFLQVDQTIVKQYSQIKQKVLQNRDRIETCEDPKDLENIKKNIQKLSGVKITNKNIKLNKETQKNLNTNIQEYNKIKKQIENCQQIIKDYSIKIIQIVTDHYDTYDRQNKKTNAKNYFSLRTQLMSQFMGKNNIIEESNINTNLIEQIPKKTKQKYNKFKDIKKTQMNKSHKIIQQILDLYKNESL